MANVEIGRQNVPLDFWQRCDALLGGDGALVRGHEEIQLLVRCDAENCARQVAFQCQQKFATMQDDLGSTLAPIARVALHDIRRGQHGDRVSQLFAAMHAVRNSLERSLVNSSVTAGQLDDLEETVAVHAHDCVRLPPIDMLCRLTLDTADVRGLLAQPQPPQTGLRLRRISAGLAVLMADELMVLGDVYAARSWYATARNAADITEDNALRATIYTLSAMLPLYWGRPAQAAKIGSAARELAGASSCMASAMAPSIEAFALVKIGDQEMSARVLDHAATAFERLAASQRDESVFAFSERRYLFYRGRSLTWLGRYREAGAVHDQAKALYPPDVVGDPTLMQLDRAVSFVHVGDIESACELATSSLIELPAEHRGGIFLHDARRLLEVMPRHQQHSAPVQEYVELLRSLTPLPISAREQ